MGHKGKIVFFFFFCVERDSAGKFGPKGSAKKARRGISALKIVLLSVDLPRTVIVRGGRPPNGGSPEPRSGQREMLKTKRIKGVGDKEKIKRLPLRRPNKLFYTTLRTCEDAQDKRRFKFLRREGQKRGERSFPVSGGDGGGLSRCDGLANEVGGMLQKARKV